MDKRYQVFVSSTFRDLQEERRNVTQILMNMNCIPSGMEWFPAIDEEVWSYIQREIDDCDYYLLIVAGLYGSLAPDGISFTEKEFNYAVETKKRIIALLHSAPDEIPSKFTEKEQEARDKLQAFRKKAQDGRLVKYWRTADELAGKVTTSLLQTMSIFPAEGWVRGNHAASIEILNELNEVRKKKEELEIEVNQLQQRLEGSIFTPNEEKEFEYIIKILSKSIKLHCGLATQSVLEPLSDSDRRRIDTIKAPLMDLIINYLNAGYDDFENSSFIQYLQLCAENKGYPRGSDVKYSREARLNSNVVLELQTCGLLKSVGITSISDDFKTHYQYREKLYRLRYWLGYKGYQSNDIQIEVIEGTRTAHKPNN
jgi:hypothetical protein